MSPIGNGTAAEMRDALERVGRGVLDYLDGDPGVQTMCPLCAHGIVLWTEQSRRWICSQPDCPGREDSSRIAYALEDEGPGGFAQPEEPKADFANCHAPKGSANGKVAAERFTTRRLDASEFRPVEFAWEQRLVRGVLNVLAGTEGIGKGTLLAWLIAQLTRGGLPGSLRGKPARVLWLGDEDSWTHVVGPRLHAAGADLALVEEMISSDGRLFNVHQDAAELDRIVTAGPFDVVVFEALLDHMPAGRNGDPTQHVRLSLAPTRAVFRRRGTTALATMHTRKGPSSSFRDLMAGSHQYNALSRSSLLLAAHPDDERRRIIVAGKQNYSRAASTESFELVEHGFDLNEHRFSVSLARDFRVEPEITIDSLLVSSRSDARDDLGEQLRGELTREPRRLSDLARAVGRDPADGTVRRALEALEEVGDAERAGRGLWRLKPIGAVAS